MTVQKKQTLMQGAIILAGANLLVKIIGMFFKIPLTRLLQEDGMGLFNSAYTVYTFMFVVATAGFPVAVSKMVAERVSLGKNREAERIFLSSVILLAVLGLAGSFALYLGAVPFANLVKNERAYLGIMAISPAILCVALMSAFRGYFQGHQNMYPTAISEVVEAVGKLGIGYLLAAFFMQKSVDLASAGAVFGVTCGTFLSFLCLLIIYFWKKRKKQDYSKEPTASYRSLAKELMVIAVPITIGASVASLTNVIDMMTVMRRLQEITATTAEFQAKYVSLIDFNTFTGAIGEELANKLYGLYTGYAVPLFNMPLTIVTALSMSVVPAIASSLAKRDAIAAKQVTQSVIKITILFALPCAIGMSVLSESILMLLFENALATSLLQKLSIAVIFVSLLSVTSAILQAYGHMLVPVVNMFIGGIIKVIINYTLVANPAYNIDGAPIGTIVCYFTIVVMNLIWIARVSGARYSVSGFFAKPILATAVMGVTVYACYQWLLGIGMSIRLVCLPAICVGIAVYAVMVLLTRSMNRDDVEMLPKGKRLAALLSKWHLLK